MDQRVPSAPDQGIGDELAECLQRFLTARADEQTMQRARQALARWHGQAQREPAAVPELSIV